MDKFISSAAIYIQDLYLSNKTISLIVLLILFLIAEIIYAIGLFV